MAKKKKIVPKKENSGSTSKTKIRVIGIGGGGGSIVAEISSGLTKIDFTAINTDKRSLKEISRKVKTFQFGEKMTGGLGTGMDPEVGRNAAEAEKEKIKKIFTGQDVCILLACLGGGTSSGAAPVLAKLAKESGSITYGIFTLPFEFEGSRKMEIAKESLEEIKPHLNAISVLPNENIFKIIEKDAPLKEALSMINSSLSENLKGLIEAIYNPGLINIDFADFKTVLEGKGKIAYLHSVIFEPSKGIDQAINQVTSNPFYSHGIDGAGGVLLNVTGNKKIGLRDVSQVSSCIAGLAKKNATIILGITHDEKYNDKMKIMVLGVGCETKDNPPEKKKPEPKKKEKPKKKINKKKDSPVKKLKVEVKPRRNALEIKKASEDVEKELLEEEKKWETPAFLRRK